MFGEIFGLAGIFTVNPSANAAISAEEAANLGSELTPLGAEMSGNATGTIPNWDDGITEAPASYQPGKHHPNPFPGDSPLFVITAENYHQYSENLTQGHIAMFERYPETFRMPIYPTRRSASLPQRIYDKSIANATKATLSEDGNGVLNAAEGIPFPIPKNGLEVIWNHLLRYRGDRLRRVVEQATPTVSGDYIPVTLVEEVLFTYHLPGSTNESINNRLVYFLQELTAPPIAAGIITLAHETLNQAAELRQVWIYNPGQRRVRRAPSSGYDTPGTECDGQRTADQLDMYNGAPDRYDWQLVGKKEIYIPYNSYRLHSNQTSVANIVTPGHINSDLARYELRRVWIVDATLKEGTSHVYARRTFYLDEDSWQITVADNYDGSGSLWCVSVAHLVNYYDVPVTWITLDPSLPFENILFYQFNQLYFLKRR